MLHRPTDKIPTDAPMSNPLSHPTLRTTFGEVELRPAGPAQGKSDRKPGMRVYVLLPDLDELLGVPGFGLRDPIRVAVTRPARATSALH